MLIVSQSAGAGFRRSESDTCLLSQQSVLKSHA
nr:MAG TPA: hypothetical protein [Caudoviricetes sp.]